MQPKRNYILHFANFEDTADKTCETLINYVIVTLFTLCSQVCSLLISNFSVWNFRSSIGLLTISLRNWLSMGLLVLRVFSEL